MPINFDLIYDKKKLEKARQDYDKPKFPKPKKFKNSASRRAHAIAQAMLQQDKVQQKTTKLRRYYLRLDKFHATSWTTSIERMRALQKIAKFTAKKILPKDYQATRAAYERKKWSFEIKDCFVCSEPAVHRHHLVLIKNGGTNIPKNIVGLCEFCHNGVHPWMMAAWEQQQLDERMNYLIGRDI